MVVYVCLCGSAIRIAIDTQVAKWDFSQVSHHYFLLFLFVIVQLPLHNKSQDMAMYDAMLQYTALLLSKSC